MHRAQMSLPPGPEPLADVPEQLDDGSRLVGVAASGTPVYHDPTASSFQRATGTDDGDVQSSRPLDPDESVADAITAVEHSGGWAVLSEYALQAFTDE